MNLRTFIIFLVLVTVAHSFPFEGISNSKEKTERRNVEYESAEYWVEDAQNQLLNKLNNPPIEGKAKNVIIFLGDGMSIATITAARILKGQKVDNLPFGEEAQLHMDTFPYAAMSKTFCSDHQVADSACSATAYLCGTKANSGTVGVTPSVKKGDCLAQSLEENQVSSIIAWAQAAGKSTGIISTSGITDASSAATYAHSANRDWESNSGGNDPTICPDIATQMILGETGKNINVILGGGRLHFRINSIRDPESNQTGNRQDVDLIETYKEMKNNSNSIYLTTRKELLAVNVSSTDYILGLFSPYSMEYYHDQVAAEDPSLEEMTQIAIEILKKNENGYVLFVEGGRIDDSHHENLIHRSLWETVEFDKAIKKGDEMTDDDDTLLVVTADHAHVLTFAADSPRGNPIIGIAQLGEDGLPYAMLGYANGPGYRNYTNGTRPDVSEDDFDNLDYRPPTPLPLGSETHGGDDVLILSKGPFARYLSGVQHQSLIPHVMGFAACIGPGIHSCSENNENNFPKLVKRQDESEHEDAQFWMEDAQNMIKTQRQRNLIEKKAKNVIFFLGDGMSVATITASRIFKGQMIDNATFGEEASLHMDTLHYTAMSKTFCADSQVADSACTSTAYLSGSKGTIGTVGLTPNVFRNDCEGQTNIKNHVSSIMTWAQEAGMSTGVISTSRITDASPSGAYAHTADRNWETDTDIINDGYDPKKCIDIASQLILHEPGNKLNVILSGGRIHFLPNTTLDQESNERGRRSDGVDLIETFLSSKNKAIYITDKAEIHGVNIQETDYVLGLFSPGDMEYLHERESNGDPTLEEMTALALQILGKNSKGFVLFAEGAKIDSAHHLNLAQRALWETIEMDNAIKLADEMTDDEDTLIVVSADHAHVMSFSGTPLRGNSILGVAGIGDDGLPYGTLGYANGPSYREYVDGVRPDISKDNLTSIDYQVPSSVPRSTETHGGDDVVILSKGPFAHLLTGIQQQSYIPHLMGFAACIGPGITFCSEQTSTFSPPTIIDEIITSTKSSSSSTHFNFNVLIQLFLFDLLVRLIKYVNK